MHTQRTVERRMALHGKRWELEGEAGTFEYHPYRKNYARDEIKEHHVLLLRLDSGGVWIVTDTTVEAEAAQFYGP